MNITLEQSLGSAIRYIQEIDESNYAYFDYIPEDFIIPSLYFPVPLTDSRQVTLSSFRVTLALDCWFLDKTDWEANARAVAVRDQMIMDRLIIPIISPKEEETGKGFRIDQPEIQQIDEGTVKLSFEIKTYLRPEEEKQLTWHFYNVWKNTTQLLRR